jgi:Flp pilus assembly protein TadG
MGMTKRRLAKDRRGAAAVELAIISPLLVLIAFGGIDVGQFVNLSQVASNATREGARKASRNDTLAVTEVETTVHDYLDNNAGIPSSAVQVTVLDGAGAPIPGGDLTTIDSGEVVSVQVTIQFEAVRWISFLNFLTGATNSTTSNARRE